MNIASTLDYLKYAGTGLLGAGIAIRVIWRQIVHLPRRARLAIAIGTAVALGASCLGLVVILTKTPSYCMCRYDDPSIFRDGGHHE